MAKKFSKTKITAAVSAAAFGAGLTAPAGAVVVVGGNDGWEVSFDGNVNAFYTVGDYDAGYVVEPADTDNVRVTSGFLPAFFSFNVKSPTVNGVTGTGRISFAPVIHNGGAKTQFAEAGNSAFGAGGLGGGALDGISGAQIDTREVLANLEGAFGEVSFGRTLSLFGRQAILNDMTLFGVGFVPGANHFGSVTFGRVGHGYTYPDFAARFQYTTPNVNGFQVALGLYDPSTIDFRGGGGVISGINRGTLDDLGNATGGLLDETDIPRFEGEFSYAGAFHSITFKAWIDGLWQEINSTCSGPVTRMASGTPVNCGDLTASAWGTGAKLGAGNFEFVGYYHDNEGLGMTAQFNSLAVAVDSSGNIIERKGEGWYTQGTYTFGGKTKLGIAYGEGRLEDAGDTALAGAGHVKRSLWTVGVYHDVSSWLRLIAEYNHGEVRVGGAETHPEADTFSVGGFLFW